MAYKKTKKMSKGMMVKKTKKMSKGGRTKMMNGGKMMKKTKKMSRKDYEVQIAIYQKKARKIQKDLDD